MARYIDADKLRETFFDGVRVYDGKCTVADIIHNIDNTPTADVTEVKHGKWDCRDENSLIYSCSECDDWFMLNEGTPKENGFIFCPHCGAKMDGE